MIRANRALEQILGYEPQALEGKRFAELTHPRLRCADLSVRLDDLGAAVQLRSEQCYVGAMAMRFNDHDGGAGARSGRAAAAHHRPNP